MADEEDGDEGEKPTLAKGNKSSGKKGGEKGNNKGGKEDGKKTVAATGVGGALAAALSKGRKGDSLGTDAAQAGTRLLVKEAAEVCAKLVPDGLVERVAHTLGTEQRTLNVLATGVGFALDRTNLVGEGMQGGVADFLMDSAGSLGDRMRTRPALKAATAATALEVKEKDLAQLLAQKGFGADATNPKALSVHPLTCHVIAGIVERNKVVKKGGARTPIVEFSGYAVRAQNLDVYHDCCRTITTDYFGRVDALEKEVDKLKPQDFDALLRTPEGLKMQQNLNSELTENAVLSGDIDVHGVIISFPKGIIGCLRESGFERTDLDALTQPGITKAELVQRLVVIRDRNPKTTAATATFRALAKEALDVGGEVAGKVTDVASAMNKQMGVGVALRQIGDEAGSWAATLAAKRQGYHTPPAVAIVPAVAVGPIVPVTRREAVMGLVDRSWWKILIVIVVLFVLWRQLV